MEETNRQIEDKKERRRLAKKNIEMLIKQSMLNL